MNRADVGSLDEYEEAQKKGLEEVESVFYPNLPDKRLPSSLTNEQIVGHYYDPGYGTLRIVEADIDGKTQLVANRTEPIFAHELRFKHVSGNYWLVDAYVTDTRSIAGSYAAEFEIGVDGEASGLAVQMTPKGQMGEPNVSFKRV